MFNQNANNLCNSAMVICAKFAQMTTKSRHASLERLLRVAADHDIEGPSALAGALGESEQTVTNWARRGVSKNGAIKAQIRFGTSANWVLTGENSYSKPSDSDRFTVREPTAVYMANKAASPAPSTLRPILSWEHPDDLPPGEFVMIPRLDVRLSAGNGHEQVEIEFSKAQPQAFRSDWIRNKRLKPAKLACMNASGDSMEPSIWDGDSLVVDTASTEIVDGKPYALWYEGGERVKRLYRLPGGGLRIKSDNPDYETINLAAEALEHVRIIGRVVHRSGQGGL